MPEENEQQIDASVDDLAATIGAKLAQFKEEDKMLAEEEATIKARRKLLKGEIDKAERITRSMIPRTRKPKSTEVNPPVQQPPVQTESVSQANAPAFQPE